jgi:predicted HicB family RNase H-like nuclease
MAPSPLKLFAVRVPAELHRRCKIEAARRGVSLAALVEAALRAELRSPTIPSRRSS